MGICYRMRGLIWFMSLVVLGISGCTKQQDTDVEFVPTPEPVIIAMLKMAGVDKDDVVYDLGCGDGRIVTLAAQLFGARGVGVDVDPSLLKQGAARSRKAGVTGRVTYVRGDLFATDLTKATVVTLYLTPELNLRLRPKLFRELKPGTRVLAHDFNMSDWKPDQMGRLYNVTYEYPDRIYKRDAPFYLWVMPADVSGTWHGVLATANAERSYRLRLAQTFQEISGVLSLEGRERPITEARLSGGQLSFTCRDDRDKEKVVLWFNGRVTGNTIEGAVEIYGGESPGNFRWLARRAP